MLTSSTVAETDYAAWNAATSYALEDRVIRTSTHRIYERLIAGTSATAPESDPTNWLDIGPTNKWAMFDEQIGTATTASESLTVVMAPGRINSIALLEVDAATISVELTVLGDVVYSATLETSSGNATGDWYQYFYEPVYEQNTFVAVNLVDASLLDLPAYGEGVLTVTLTRPGGTVSCGVLVAGMFFDLGETLSSPAVGIVDYSRKSTDAFGNTVVVKRKYSKRVRANVIVYNANVDSVARVLAQYRSTPMVWVGSGNSYSSLLVYGFYKDWDMVIQSPIFSTLSLQIEGLT